MSAIADITVYDGAATPVAHVLKAIDVTRDAGRVTANWRENLASIPVYAQVHAQMTITRMKSGVYKTDCRVVVPVMESVSGQNAAGYTAAPKVAYENTYISTGFFHERSDSAGRRLVRQLGINIANGVSTAVTPSSSGPFYDLFEQLVAPT